MKLFTITQILMINQQQIFVYFFNQLTKKIYERFFGWTKTKGIMVCNIGLFLFLHMHWIKCHHLVQISTRTSFNCIKTNTASERLVEPKYYVFKCFFFFIFFIWFSISLFHDHHHDKINQNAKLINPF